MFLSLEWIFINYLCPGHCGATDVVGVRMPNKQRGVNLIVYRVASGTCTANGPTLQTGRVWPLPSKCRTQYGRLSNFPRFVYFAFSCQLHTSVRGCIRMMQARTLSCIRMCDYCVYTWLCCLYTNTALVFKLQIFVFLLPDLWKFQFHLQRKGLQFFKIL